MNTEEILNKLLRIVAPYVLNKDLLVGCDHNTRFVEDLQINSANLVDIILDVEDEFNVHIDDQEIESMLQVKNVIGLIQAQSNAA